MGHLFEVVDDLEDIESLTSLADEFVEAVSGGHQLDQLVLRIVEHSR